MPLNLQWICRIQIDFHIGHGVGGDGDIDQEGEPNHKRGDAEMIILWQYSGRIKSSIFEDQGIFIMTFSSGVIDIYEAPSKFGKMATKISSSVY